MIARERIDEVYQGGRLRSVRNREAGRREYFTWVEGEDHEHMNGCAAVAELIVAFALGREWVSQGDEPDDPNEGDVEGHVSVRWTERPTGSLVLRRSDPDHLSAVLVTGPLYEMAVVGWLPVAEGKRPEFWREDVPYPAWFVPQAALRPIEQLREPQATDEARPSAGAAPGEPAPAEREDTRDLSLRDLMARAMKVQGKVDPAAVFEEAQHIDLDDDSLWAHEMRDDPGPDLAPLDPTQEALALDEPEPEPRDYTWEP